MKYRPEDFPLKLLDARDAEHAGRHEEAVLGNVQPLKEPALALHLLAVGCDPVARLRVDHRADVGAERTGIADHQGIHGAEQHLQQAILHVALDIEDPQGRTALPGALERTGQNVAHRLLGQRGRIDDHGVEPAGLCDQHGLGRALGELLVDQLRDLGRAGEADPGDPRVGGQPRADRRSVSGQQLNHVLGHAGLAHQGHGARGDQRGLFGRLGDHRVAGHQRGGDLSGEDRQWKVPGAEMHRNDPDGRAGTTR